MTREKLQAVLELHKRRLYAGSGASLDLSGADLFKANLSRENLFGANLSEANLFGANLQYTCLLNAQLSDAKLAGANLSGANLSGANLSGANLSEANLYRANLHSANLSRTVLSVANLYLADLTGTCLDPANEASGVSDEFAHDGDYTDYVIGYRTREAGHIDKYRDGRVYSADWFSTDNTECHPGLYLWPTLAQAREGRSDVPMIRVRAPARHVHKAGSKWRCRWFEVLGPATE